MSYDPHQQPYAQRPDRQFSYPPAPEAPAPPPTSQPAPDQQTPAPRQPRWPYLVLAAALLLLACGLWSVYDRGLVFKDSGIKVCEAFRDGKKFDGAPLDTKADGKMSEAQYLQLRGVFKDSRHDDIRQAGTRLMDVMWQVTQLGPDPGLEALPLVGQVTSAATEMQGACANHGIVINILKDAQSAN